MREEELIEVLKRFVSEERKKAQGQVKRLKRIENTLKSIADSKEVTSVEELWEKLEFEGKPPSPPPPRLPFEPWTAASEDGEEAFQKRVASLTTEQLARLAKDVLGTNVELLREDERAGVEARIVKKVMKQLSRGARVANATPERQRDAGPSEVEAASPVAEQRPVAGATECPTDESPGENADGRGTEGE